MTAAQTSPCEESLLVLPLTLSIFRFHRGDVLITTATGVMTEEEGEKWGLVPTHAYAVLDIREYKVSVVHWLLIT